MREWLLPIIVLLGVGTARSLHGQGTAADYERAARLSGLTQNKVFKTRVTPNWLPGNQRLWYRNDLAGGAREYVFVDAETGTRRLAFDHARLAEALARVSGKEHKGTHLAIDKLDPSEPGVLRFTADGKRWTCKLGDLGDYQMVADDSKEAPQTPPQEKPPRPGRRPFGFPRLQSPDGQWAAFFKEHNVYLRDRKTSEEFQLSRDGTAEDAYSGEVVWSPDSKKLVAIRTRKGDDRKVHLIESSPRDQVQPKLHSYDYRKPGDAIPQPKPHLFDVATRTEIPISDELFSTPWSVQEVRWSPDSSQFTFLYNQRGHQALRVVAVDAATGDTRAIIDETSPTFIDYAHKKFSHYLDKTGEIIWMSERSGWNHSLPLRRRDRPSEESDHQGRMGGSRRGPGG